MHQMVEVNVYEIGKSFEGEWSADYPGHYQQFVKVELRGSTLIATKLTGDNFVPAGKETWRIELSTWNGLQASAEMHIAEVEYKNPRTLPAKASFKGTEKIILEFIETLIEDGVENIYQRELEFRRDD